jgi:L-seryl-tRNA(Ser) seleniumtransferase
VALGGEHGIPVMEDQGSGVLVDLSRFGLRDEPTVGARIAAGVDVVTCSGDKLLGGPQAGILAGKWHVIAALKKHPLARAMRLDKMTLAALETTLRAYLDPERAVAEIPTLRMLAEPATAVGARAEALAARLRETCGDSATIATREDVSRAGGGALPLADIPTVVVAGEPRAVSARALEERLRLGEPAIVARIADDRVLIDPRTLLSAAEEDAIVARVSEALGA